jgi:hypothetical protein
MKSQFYIKKEIEKEYYELRILMEEKKINITQIMNALTPVLRRALDTTFNPKFKTIKIDELIRIEQ